MVAIDATSSDGGACALVVSIQTGIVLVSVSKGRTHFVKRWKLSSSGLNVLKLGSRLLQEAFILF